MSDRKKVIAYGCWSNERHIHQEDQAGVIKQRLFETPEAAVKWYENELKQEGVLVKVIVTVHEEE